MDGIVIANLVGAAEGFLAAFAILSQVRRRRRNFWLGLMVGICALLCVGEAITRSDLPLTHPDAILWVDGLILALGPSIYLYLRTFTGRPSPLGRAWVHFLPALVVSGLIWTWHLLPRELKLQEIQRERIHPPAVDVILVLAVAQILGYLVACLVHLARRSEALRDQASNLDRISFQWLRRLIGVNILLFLVWVPSITPGVRWAQMAAAIAFPLAIYLLAAAALLTPEVFAPSREALEGATEGEAPPLAGENQVLAGEVQLPLGDDLGPEEPPVEGAEEVPPERKYQKSRLPESLLARYQQRLEAVMEAQKGFLDPDLTLAGLAQRMGITPHHLSQVLNERLGTRFCDYVNALRIAEAKRLLSNPALSGMSVLDLAMRSGFSSKGTFNLVFKRSTGQTPTAWREGARTGEAPV